MTFTVALASAPQDAEAYRVVIEKLGINAVLYAGSLSTTSTFTPTSDINVTAADVSVTPIDLPVVTSVIWSANSITVNFDSRVDVTSGALTTGVAGAVVIDNTASNATSITYQVNNVTLAAGNTFTLDLTHVTGARYSGNDAIAYATADGTTVINGNLAITLQSGNTAALAQG